MLQHSRLPAQLTRSCMSSGRRCLTCDTANPFLKAFCSSCTLSFRCFCELEHACSAQWWIRVITYGCTKVLLTLTLKISDCSSIALNQDPQAFSHAQANLGTGTPYCSPPLLGNREQAGDTPRDSQEHSSQWGAHLPQENLQSTQMGYMETNRDIRQSSGRAFG